MISGLTKTMGFCSLESSTSMTTRRFVTPTWGAAIPQPLLLYIARAICLASFFKLWSPGVHGSHTWRRSGSGAITILTTGNTSFIRLTCGRAIIARPTISLATLWQARPRLSTRSARLSGKRTQIRGMRARVGSKTRYAVGVSLCFGALGSSVTISLIDAARPAIPWISEGMMSLVARPFATHFRASYA